VIIGASGPTAKGDIINPTPPPLDLTMAIVVVGPGPTPPDPSVTYTFNVSLAAAGTVDGDFPTGPVTSFTILNLPGIVSPVTFGSSTPSNPSGFLSWAPTTAADPLGGTDVTWTYLGTSFTPSATPPSSPPGLPAFWLGTLSVTGTPATDVTGGNNVSASYTASLNGGTANGGTTGSAGVVFQNETITEQAVPEPSTAIAPLMAMLGLPLVMLLKRRKRRDS
jgi:hypothetical protein